MRHIGNISRLCLLWITAIIVASGTGWAADSTEKITEEQVAVKKLRRVSTNIQFNKDEAKTVRLVRLSKPAVTDEHLVHVKLFKKIDYLAIISPAVTDAGIENVRELTNLDTLLLSGTKLTDTGLPSLANLKKLERLYLDDTNITDAGLKRLAGLTTLKMLSLRRTKVTDAGLSQLKTLANLEVLYLDGTAVSDAGLKHLSGFANLRTLHLNGTKVTGPGLVHLAGLKKLENLNLTSTQLKKSAVDALGKLAHLKRLSLFETDFDAELVDQIRKKLSKTGIYGIALRPANVPASTKPSTTQAKNKSKPASADGPILTAARDRFAKVGEQVAPDFQRHVVPLFGRLGCNGRSCHGSFQGQGGFRLSMFGYDFEIDHRALTKGDEPRVNLKDPAASLILEKPTSDENHGGGQRFETGKWEYNLLSRWISAGAIGRAADAAKFIRLEVSPSEIVFQKADETRQLKVISVWSDGSREDVTCLTRFQSNDESVAEVTPDGLIRSAGKGDTYVVAFYDNGIESIQIIRPVSELVGDRYPDIPTPTRIDELVVEKLSKLGIVQAEQCSDTEFLRRVSLDIIGTLPTPDEIQQFVAESSPEKRSHKIDELLKRPAYVTWWTTRLCDLTGSNAGYLGGTEMAQPVAKQWRDWIERRVRDNVGYDKIVEGIVLATSRKPGQTYEEFVVEQSGYTRRQEPTDFTALDNSMPHYWFRSNISKPQDKALAFGYTFLGVRLQCAQCHKHPFDQWSKQDFEMFKAFFARIKTGAAPDAFETRERMREMLGVPVKLNTAALRRQSYLRIASEGQPIPWKEVYIEKPGNKPQIAKMLGGEEVDLSQYNDPRVLLMQWLKEKENPYFARAFVNRIWANYFNVGIVDPPDDLNMANPPSNKSLLNYLTSQFVAHGYDLKWLHREITNSRTYQLSWRPNDSNRRDERNYSHSIIRRLPAEVIVDAVVQSTANDAVLKTFGEKVTGRKIGDHPRSFQARAIDYSLLVFGKPLRTTNCDCERQEEPTLLQALYIRNDKELLDRLDRKNGWLTQVALELKKADPKSEKKLGDSDINRLVESAYLRSLGRRPNETELADCRQHILEAEATIEGLRDLMWALLNSQEFITNH